MTTTAMTARVMDADDFFARLLEIQVQFRQLAQFRFPQGTDAVWSEAQRRTAFTTIIRLQQGFETLKEVAFNNLDQEALRQFV